MKSGFYYVYIIKCSDKTYYTGITNNLHRRFTEHVDGINKNSYTFKRRPLELVFSEIFIDVNQAIQFEKRLKKWSKAKKDALINQQYHLLPALSSKKKK